jgi:hypothetical protein
MGHEYPRSSANRCREDRDVLGIRKLVGPIAIVHSRALDLDRNRAEELLEERAGFRELGGQVPSNLRDGGLREHQTRETKLAEYQDRVAGSRSRQ